MNTNISISNGDIAHAPVTVNVLNLHRYVLQSVGYVRHLDQLCVHGLQAGDTIHRVSTYFSGGTAKLGLLAAIF